MMDPLGQFSQIQNISNVSYAESLILFELL